MKSIIKKSVSRNLAISLMTTVAIVSALVIGLVWFMLTSTARKDLEQSGDEYSSSLAKIVAGPVWNFDMDRLEDIGNSYFQNKILTSIRVRDKEGQLLLDLHRGKNDSIITLSRNINYMGKDLGQVEIKLTSRILDDKTRSLFVAGLLTTVIILLTLFVATGVLLRKFLKTPLDQLSQVAMTFADGSVGSDDTVEPGVYVEEFAPLVAVLGKMRAKISGQMAELQEAQEELEQKVKVRTEDLHQKNTALEQEIISRQQAEVELRKLSRATEQSPVSVVITDTEGTIEYVNPKFSEVTGYSFEEAIGNNPRILNSGQQPPEFYQDLWTTIKAGRVWSGEFANKKKNGIVFWENAIISPVRNRKGEITHFVAVKEEITEKKAAEEANKKRADSLAEARVAMLNMMEDLDVAKGVAEEATKAKSDFLANMSHEIRTPMNAIIGMSHLAMKTELTPKQHDYISKVRSSANALLGIINDILDFSKIEAGKLDMESTNFQLEEVLNNLANLIGIKAEERGLELLFNVDQETPTALVGDPLRLGQILINLANNAVKFTEVGEIVVGVSVVEKDESKATLQFSVQDTGIGLTEEQKGRLFQAFSQADTSTTRKFGGTGLGLTISKKLCEMMGGEIWVESEPGDGSTFIFTAVFGLHAEKKIPLLPSPDLRGKRVLVVDDNQTSREILHQMLDSMTFEVSQTVSGEEALSEISKADGEGFPYEVIYLDWQMPGLDGIATSKRIKALALSQQPKIIMVTAYGREEIMRQAEDIQLEGFLVKPVSRSLLFDATMHVFGKEGGAALPGVDKNKDVDALKDILGARILLAEDNEINQQVAQEILEQAGMIVEIAGNGIVAVEMAAKNMYDAILMDIQMPEMNGFEATKAIRELQDPETRSQHPAASLPIIAMTAHAMAGDREKSLEGGMNDHVTKPIDPDELFRALLQWIEPGTRDQGPGIGEQQDKDTIEEQAGGVPLPANLPGIDMKNGLSRVGGNEKLYRSLLVKLYRDYAESTHHISEALENDDKELATRLAHTVKGVAGNLGARDLQAAAADVEAAIKKDSLESIHELMDAFEQNITSVMDGLRGFVAAEESVQEIKEEKEEGNPAQLVDLLADLEPHVKRKKPKQCKEIFARINGYAWPSEYSGDVTEIGRLIGKYRFKDVETILNELTEKLKQEIET